MRNFFIGFIVGIILSVSVYLLTLNVSKVNPINIDERVQREIDSSGFNSLDPIGRGRFLDSLAHIRAK